MLYSRFKTDPLTFDLPPLRLPLMMQVLYCISIFILLPLDAHWFPSRQEDLGSHLRGG